MAQLNSGNATSFTFTVPNLKNYSELLLLCNIGTTGNDGKHRVMASTVIPIENFTLNQ